MKLQFEYRPEMERFPLEVGMGGANDSTKTAFAQRAIEADVDIHDEAAVVNFAKKVIEDSGIDMRQALARADTAWQTIEPLASDTFTKMFATDWEPGSIKAYLTLSQRCPYRYPDHFWIYYATNAPIANCLHEIQHFYAHKFVLPMFEEAGKTALFNGFKESLSVFLNVEFADSMEREDRGYPQHAELRKHIESQYRRGITIVDIAAVYLGTSKDEAPDRVG